MEETAANTKGTQEKPSRKDAGLRVENAKIVAEGWFPDCTCFDPAGSWEGQAVKCGKTGTMVCRHHSGPNPCFPVFWFQSLGCLQFSFSSNSVYRIFTISTGAGFLPSTIINRINWGLYSIRPPGCFLSFYITKEGVC